jgi:hypothetical protein
MAGPGRPHPLIILRQGWILIHRCHTEIGYTAFEIFLAAATGADGIAHPSPTPHLPA